MQNITIRVETGGRLEEALPGGGVRSWIGDTRDFTTQVSVDRFANWLGGFIKEGKVERCYSETKEWKRPRYGQFMEEVGRDLCLVGRELLDYWPKLRILRNDGDWVVIRLQEEADKPGGTVTAPRQCLFFYKGELFPMPEDCSCEPVSGEITVRYYDRHPNGESWVPAGQITTRPDDGEGWPNLLLNPKLWVAGRRFAEYMDNHGKEDHPIVGLIRSPNPYRTIGHQIQNELLRLEAAIGYEVGRSLGHDLYKK